MKIRIEWLPQFLRRQFLLQILVVCVAVVISSQQSFCADRSVVQWRNGNDSNVAGVSGVSSASISRDLRWRTPSSAGVNSFTRDSQHVIPLPETESQIVFAQHVESNLQPPSTTPTPALPGVPASKPVDPFVQEHFNRGIPAPTPNPPTGATNTPSTQSDQSSTTENSAEKKQDELNNKNQNAKDRNKQTGSASSKPANTTGQNQSGNIADATTKSSTNNSTATQNLYSDILTKSFIPTPADKNAPTHNCKVIGFKPINEISCDIKPRPGQLPDECPLTSEPYTGRHFNQTCFQWKASAVCTKGAYFENVQLERYGHSVCPLLEPVISGVKFFTTIPILPYKAGLTPPNECVYTLGHYRVGNCAPHTLDPLPISVRAILFEGAAVAGAVAIIP
ncbi:MAG: hypothetical protein LBT09_15555 [Planctomycetaceae bacterium]|jgi:hypothetical protein|nr:hypothetical protein [Planctomycetaceae bacterium]